MAVENRDIEEQTTNELRDEFNAQLEEMRDSRGLAEGQPGKRNALARWFCQEVLGISDEDQNEDAVAIGCPPTGYGPPGGGVGDKGIDFFSILNDGAPQDEQEIVWGQCKLGDNLNYEFDEDDLDELTKTIAHLEDKPEDANKIFLDKANIFTQMGGVDGPAQKIIYIVVGGNITQAVEDKINPNSEYYRNNFTVHTQAGNLRLEVYDIGRLLQHITLPETPNVRIKFSETPIFRTTDEQKSLTGYIQANELIRMVTRVGLGNLVAYNPRTFKGKTAGPNRRIEETLQNPEQRRMFWKLNNGLTATCKKLNELDSEPNFYEISDLKIVNGAQTTSTLLNNRGSVDETVEIGIKIHETADENERLSISRATNTQNPIREIDLMSQRPEHENIVLQCKREYPNFWYERQSYSFKNVPRSTKTRITTKRVLDKGKLSYSFYAYAIDPHRAIRLNDSTFFDPDELTYYRRVFFDPTDTEPNRIRSVKELILAHIFRAILGELQNKVLKKQNAQMAEWVRGGRTGENPYTTTEETSQLLHKELWMGNGDSEENLTESIRKERILLKEFVKQYVLNWIYQSLQNFNENERNSIEDEIIRQFSEIESRDRIPIEFLRIGSAAYKDFMSCYDFGENLWPEKPNPENPTETIRVAPSATEVKDKLGGDSLVEILMNNRRRIHDSLRGSLRENGQPEENADSVRVALSAFHLPIDQTDEAQS